MKTQNPAPNPAPKRFTQYPISKVKDFSKVERYRVQKGSHRYVITSCGEIVGYLLPISEAGMIKSWHSTYDVTLTDFRQTITGLWGLLSSETRDCIYITFHNRRIMAFVSPKFQAQISLPLIGNPNQVVFKED